MAAQMLPAELKPGMLVLADRGFYSFKLFRLGCASGAMLAWRVSATVNLDIEQELPDGSFLSTVYDFLDTKRKDGQIVRVMSPAAVIPSHSSEGATDGGKLKAGSRTEDFVRLVQGRTVHLPLSGRTMEFDRDAKCVAGC